MRVLTQQNVLLNTQWNAVDTQWNRPITVRWITPSVGFSVLDGLDTLHDPHRQKQIDGPSDANSRDIHGRVKHAYKSNYFQTLYI